VLAGDGPLDSPAVMLPPRGQQALAKALGAGEKWAPGHASAQRLADRAALYGTWLPARPDRAAPAWVGTPLRVVRGDATPVIDERDDELLVFGAAERPPARCASTPALERDYLHVHPGRPHQVQQVAGVGGEDIVAILGETDHGRIDGVRSARAG
jgi:hypothetical protein